ncbi:6889_t:CDS:10 [Entrophospora sp. SA101]|nr:6889_t:CDS:10 [Entrophospora sp. SA101]
MGIANNSKNKRIWHLRDQITSTKMESELNMLELEMEKLEGRKAVHQIAKQGCYAYYNIEFGPMEQVCKTPECQNFPPNIYKRREPTGMKLRELNPVNYDESTPLEKDLASDYLEIMSRMSSVHKDYDTFAYKYEDHEEEHVDEIDKFFMDKEGNGKVYNDHISNDNDDNHFIEHIEEHQPTTHRSWFLCSGINVGNELARYVKTIPEAHKCFLIYTLIKSFFSKEDWDEINESFKRDVKLIESNIPNIVEYFFDEVEKKDDENIINTIDNLTLETIEKNQSIKLTNEDKEIIMSLRWTIITYAENLKDLKLPISEADFDNSFLNMLAKGFLDKHDLKMDVNEGHSIILHAHIGQKCNFWGTLKNSVNNLEAIIGLRSGGLPVVHCKKVFEDWVDLAVAMRDVLYNFFKQILMHPEMIFTTHTFLEFNHEGGPMKSMEWTVMPGMCYALEDFPKSRCPIP